MKCPWCLFSLSSRFQQVPISVLIDITLYVWFQCRYIGLTEYADIYWTSWLYEILWMIIGKPFTWILQSRHVCLFLAYFLSTSFIFSTYIIFSTSIISLLVSDFYLYTFFVLLLKIREGVVLGTSTMYNTYLYTLPVFSKGTNELILLVLHLYLYPYLYPLGSRLLIDQAYSDTWWWALL